MNKKIIIILTGLLFLSVAYNVWWVGFERTGSEKTILSLNKYIEYSRDIILKQEEYRKTTVDFAQIFLEALNRCAEGRPVDDLLEQVNIVSDEGTKAKEQLESLFSERTEFAKSSGLNISNLIPE
jgi:hypothetical protein